MLNNKNQSQPESGCVSSAEGNDRRALGAAPAIPRRGFRLKRSDWVFAGLLLLTVILWFWSFPLLRKFEAIDIAFDAAVLSASLLGLAFVRRSRLSWMDVGWKLLIWGHLICLLDCFTQEKGISPIAVSTAIFASESATITAVMWGLHIYLSQRRTELQELRHVVGEWRRSESRYAELVNAVDGIVWEADSKTGRYLFVSKKAEGMLGYPVSRWLEEPNFWADHVVPEDRQWATSFRLDEAGRGRSHEFEYRMVAVDGRTVWVRDIVSVLRGPNGVTRRCGVMVEIGATKQLEKILRSKAMRDDLTGMPSRAAFLDALQALDVRDKPATRYGVMFLDLDRFKLINDSLGHRIGDIVLAEAATRIAQAVDGQGYVARIGGDEFAVLSTHLNREGDLLDLASRIQREMSAPVTADRHALALSVSIGVATGRVGAGSSEETLRNADIAMYRAKNSSRGSTKIFDREMRYQMDSAFELSGQIRTALRRDEFEVHYQPVVDLEGGEIIAFEALVRWRHPERGLLSASEFLPQAEADGLGGALCWLAARQAFAKSHSWACAFRVPPLISVNINECGFAQTDFLKSMHRALRETGAVPSNLILEITEDVIGVEGAADAKLETLRAMGFHLALDDFGVGRSSLSRLLQMPIDMVKLDRAFVPHEGQQREEALIRGVVAIGRDLNISIVAEGIETQDQCRRLREFGCRTGQGYLFGRAMPADQAEAMIRSAESHVPPALCGRKGSTCPAVSMRQGIGAVPV